MAAAGLGALLKGTAVGNTLGDILGGLGGIFGGQKPTQPQTITPFVRGGIEAGSGVDPKFLIGAGLLSVVLIVVAIISKR